MGLDIYLYTADHSAANRRYNEASNALHEPGPDGKSLRDLMTDEEYKAWGVEHHWASHEDAPSEAYPSHLFNRRYLRSSYNGGGFNHAVPDLIGTAGEAEYPNARGSLYWIFEPMGREWDGDEGILTAADVPALQAARARAVEVVEALKASDRLRVTTISPNMFGGQPELRGHDALAMYRGHMATRGASSIFDDDDGSYSTNGGNLNVFGGKGLTILAAIPGKDTFTPGVHLIYRAEGDGFDYYVQSAEIVIEFCDEAIMLIERDGSCEMSWSG
jgi:hypothetical protein